MSVTPVLGFFGVTAGGIFALDQIQKYRLTLRREERLSKVREKVFMDFCIGEKYAGRVIFGLYSDEVPLTCENFVQLSRGYTLPDGRTLGYKNTQIHRVVPNRLLFGGDVLTGLGASLGASIFGKRFPDENYAVPFVQDGDLAMASDGPNTNASQFLVTLAPMPRLQGQFVCFGTVLSGMTTLRAVAETTTKMGRLVHVVTIANSGLYDDAHPPPLPRVKDPNLTEAEWRATQGA
jgi:peptidylprolyl isomerase